MFYIVEIEDHVRVEPKLFGLPTSQAVEMQLKESYVGEYKKSLGMGIAVVKVARVGKGIIIPGDGAAYYESNFKIVVWKPTLQELVYGTIEEITNFGAFINMAGVMKGMIHISQTMDDFVTFSDSESLSGRDSNRTLVKGDTCLARIVAISHKGGDPKIGLTMRQPGLGKLEWIKEDAKKQENNAKKQENETKSGKGKK